MTQVKITTNNEGVAKVSAIHMIGRGASFTYHREGENYVFLLDEANADCFPKGTVFSLAGEAAPLPTSSFKAPLWRLFQRCQVIKLDNHKVTNAWDTPEGIIVEAGEDDEQITFGKAVELEISADGKAKATDEDGNIRSLVFKVTRPITAADLV